MRKMILWTCTLALVSTVLLAQEEIFPGYSITFTEDQKSGTAVFESRTFDETWDATIKALKSDKFRIAESEKIYGTISAIRENPWGQSTDLLGTQPRWKIFMKETDGNVQLTFVAENMMAPQKAIKSLCKKIAKQLEKAK
jgi:hypothetical protein